ncbi:hypothetical protein V2J09_008911 [Rumex salicifolius]
MRVRFAALHLEGKALQWHHNYNRNHFEQQLPTWFDYIIDILFRFGKPFDDPLANLVSLKQSDGVDEYLDRFECALTRMNLPVPHALSIFLANMAPHLQLHVRQFNPTTMSEAARLAKLHESSLQPTPAKATRPSTFLGSYPRFSHQNASKTNLSSPPLTQPNTWAPNHLPTPRSSCQISQLADSLTRRCRRASPRDFGCLVMKNLLQIYFLESNEDVVEPVIDTPVEDLCLEDVGKTKLHILIDPGSTHNFVNLDVAKAIGCKLEPVKPFILATVCHKLTSEFKCSNFAWCLQGYDYCIEVRPLPLDCCDLVLGIQWLTTVGPVQWDFMSMRMEFTHKGLKHVLRGVQPCCKVIRGSNLNKLMLTNPQAYEIHYKQGKDNIATDALSRVTGSQLLQLMLSQAHAGFYDSIQQLWKNDPSLQWIISDLQSNPSSHPKYSFTDGKLRRQGKLVIGNHPAVKLHILNCLYNSAVGGHSGKDATLKRVKALFFWSGMSIEIQHYIRNCSVCQRNKYDLFAKPGLLQPLPIPEGCFLDHVFRLHGMPHLTLSSSSRCGRSFSVFMGSTSTSLSRTIPNRMGKLRSPTKRWRPTCVACPLMHLTLGASGSRSLSGGMARHRPCTCHIPRVKASLN